MASLQNYDHREEQAIPTPRNNPSDICRQKERERKRAQRSRLTSEKGELMREKNREQKRRERAKMTERDKTIFNEESRKNIKIKNK